MAASSRQRLGIFRTARRNAVAFAPHRAVPAGEEAGRAPVAGARRTSPADSASRGQGESAPPGRGSRERPAAAPVDASGPVDAPGGDTPEGDTPERDGSGRDGPATSRPVIKPLEIEVPERIGRYLIGSRIGSGTCGIVHQARDERLGREVAVKLSPAGEAHVSTGKVPGAQRAYQTEIVAAGRLTHPNIVTVHDAGSIGELNFLVMEIIHGRSLKEYGKGKALLPVHVVLSAVVDCCRALDYSHGRGILHRDIKPANIMLAEDGTVKLLDFGIAVGLATDAGLDRQGPTLGTPNYMSPEQILGRELDASSDFYSLATVLFELLTGRQLFKAKKVKELFRIVVNQPAPCLHAIRSELPKELADVLARALSKPPAERFQSGRAFAEALAPHVERFRILEARPPARRRFIAELQRQAFFLDFSDVEIALLLERVAVRDFRRGEALMTPGIDRRRLLVLTGGLARVEENDELVEVVGEGDSIGELGFINGTADVRGVVALTDVSVLELSGESLSELPPKVHLHYYRRISDRLSSRLAHGAGPRIDLTL